MPDLDARRREALAEEFCKWRHPDLALGEASPVVNHPDPRCRIATCFACQGIAALAAPMIAGWLAEAEAEALREAANAWQWGDWTTLTAPIKAPEQPQRIIGAAQAVADWLRDRGDRIGGDA